MKNRTYIPMLILAVLLYPAGAVLAEEKTLKELQFPHAGISLELPEGFVFQNLDEPFSILKAVMMIFALSMMMK